MKALAQWQGKLSAWRVSCPALWSVAECEKPAAKTRATPRKNARPAALRLSDLCPAADMGAE
jgi:hypothetical protein